jgi:D-alanine-D-alanine ligase
LEGPKKILLLSGGGGSEHEISLISASYLLENCLKLSRYKVEHVTLKGPEDIVPALQSLDTPYLVIPCLHGPPGEDGTVQTILESLNIPFLGPKSEPGLLAFNKVSCKLWLESQNIPTAPFAYLPKGKELDQPFLAKCHKLFDKFGSVIVKASNQGSSIGLYKVDKKEEIPKAIKDSLQFSEYSLVEGCIKGRELEIAVFEYENQVIATHPGEVLCPEGSIYDYEEKYSKTAKTTTEVVAKNIKESTIEKMKSYALLAFDLLKLRHLSRVDFFLADNGEIYLNEINTFPGMTPISLFPLMVENYGVKFSDYLQYLMDKEIKDYYETQTD